MRRRGFSAIIAVALIAVVGITLAVMARSFAGDVKRTRDSSADAQRRQLLLAGAVAAAQELRQAGPMVEGKTLDVALPEELRQRGGAVKVRVALSGPTVEAWVETALDGHGARQRLRYTYAQGGWRVVEARLEPRD